MSITIDMQEYANDAAAQVAYATSDYTESTDQSNTTYNDNVGVGDAGGVEYRRSQGFQVSGAIFVSAVEVKRGTNTVGTPAGNWYLRIETDSSGKPSGTLADTGATVTVTPPAEDAIIKGTFASPFILNASTTYHLVVQCDNQATNNNWRLYDNDSSVYASGTECYSSDGVWGVLASRDLYFKVYKAGNLQCYSESTIKTQGSYALKAIAAATNSLNDTLTRTVNPTIDLTGQTQIKFDIRSNRTGENVKLGIRHNDEVVASAMVCDFDGADGATTYTANIGGQVATFVGTAQLDTAQKKFGTASLLLDGDSDYITFPDNATWAFGTGAFTIDFWARFGNVSSVQYLIFHMTDADNQWYFRFYDDGQFVFNVLVAGDWVARYSSTNASVSVNTWYHIALVRSGASVYMFLNGTALTLTETTAIGSSSMPDFSGVLGVGAKTSGEYFTNGHIDELRITKGTARWTANFTPKTSAYGAVTTEKTHTIIDADTFETDTWDISAVADADKNAIDRIIATIVNADADNTFYLDNMFAESITTAIKKVCGVLYANIKKISGVAIANVKKVAGLA